MKFAEFFFTPRPSIRAVVKVAFSAATAVVIAPALRAQDAAVAASTGATLDLIDNVAVRLALRTLISDAAASGLPTGPLVTKVREGVAKHAEPERIRNATSLLAHRLAVGANRVACRAWLMILAGTRGWWWCCDGGLGLGTGERGLG